MRKAKKIYQEILNEININQDKIKELENNDIIKQYFILLKESKELEEKRMKNYKNMKLDEFRHCKHIWIISSTVTKVESYGCIKCGLDEKFYNNPNSYEFSFQEQIMYEYMIEHPSLDGIITDIYCDLELAKAIFKKIKEKNPTISDELILKYFEISLDNIRNIPVSEDRKTSRIKRLSLNTKFKRWNKSDI